MRGPRTTAIAHKKLEPLMLKGGKAKASKKSSSSSDLKRSKDLDAPKRPPTAFFVFMEEFRKHFKENFPDKKSVAAVSKAGGEKWKSMSDSDKAPYIEKASKKKAQYEDAVVAYQKKKKKTLNNDKDKEKSVESEKSTCESHDIADDDDKQEATASS